MFPGDVVQAQELHSCVYVRDTGLRFVRRHVPHNAQYVRLQLHGQSCAHIYMKVFCSNRWQFAKDLRLVETQRALESVCADCYDWQDSVKNNIVRLSHRVVKFITHIECALPSTDKSGYEDAHIRWRPPRVRGSRFCSVRIAFFCFRP